MFLFSSCFGKLISSICFPWAVWCVSRLLRFFGVLVNYPKHCVSQFPPEINPETELVEVVPNTASTGAQEQWLLLCPPAFFLWLLQPAMLCVDRKQWIASFTI